MTVDNVRRNLILGVPAVAIGAQAVAHRAFAQQNASRVNGVTPHEAFRDVKERFVNEAIGITREALDQASVLDALEWQGEFPQSALFRALELPILPAHLDDTTYDYSDLRRRYPVQLGVTSVAADSHRHVVSPRVIPAIDKDRDASFRRDGYLSDGYGNCFYWNSPDTIVTTEHLAERFPESWHSLRRDGFDISVASVAPHFAARSPQQVIRDDPSVSDADIHGSLVCIVGRDPDPWSDMDGAKVYPGVAVKMTPQFIRGALARNSSDEQTGHVIARIRTFHSKNTGSDGQFVPDDVAARRGEGISTRGERVTMPRYVGRSGVRFHSRTVSLCRNVFFGNVSRRRRTQTKRRCRVFSSDQRNSPAGGKSKKLLDAQITITAASS